MIDINYIMGYGHDNPNGYLTTLRLRHALNISVKIYAFNDEINTSEKNKSVIAIKITNTSYNTQKYIYEKHTTL